MMLNKNTKTNLGALLLRLGLIDEDQLEHAMNEHQRTGIMLSKILVRLGMVSEDALTQILGTQMQSTMKMRLGEMLLQQGYITEAQLEKALEEQKKTGQRLGRTLVMLGFLPEERLIEILSAQLDVPFIKLEAFTFDEDASTHLSDEICRRYDVVPLFVANKTLTIAMADPTNIRVVDIVKFKSRMDVDIVMASKKEIQAAVDKMYATSSEQESLADLIRDGDDELETVERGADSSVNEPELTDEEGQQVVKIVTTLIHEAIARGASDIHLEPQETHLKLRYRIDGDLQLQPPIPARLMPQILSRIKLLSKMDIAEKRKPLDGRFTVRYKGSEVDLRVSSFPVSLRKRGV